jgi:hypothetical protein
MVAGYSISREWYGETIFVLGDGVGQPFVGGWFVETVEY